MKKLVLFAMTIACLSIFNACEKSDEFIDPSMDVQLQEAVKSDVYVENGYLAFKNMNAVDSIIQLLNSMSKSEKEAWEQNIGFKSARDEYDFLYDQYDKLESYEEFLAFKKENQGKLKFNEQDPNDCSIDYPYAAGYFLPVLNNKGIYKVGKSIVKYTMEEQIVIADGDINKLKNIDVYANDKMVYFLTKLKSATTDGIHWFPEDDPSGNNDKWHTRTDISKRRINHQLVCNRWIYWETESKWRYGYCIYLNQRGQKKSWGKYRDYYTIYGIKNIKCKVGTAAEYEDNRTHQSNEVKPSIDFMLYWWEGTTTYPPSDYVSIPSVKFAAKVTFRGFGFNDSDYYLIDYPTGYGAGNNSSYPTNNWGW